VHPPAQGWQPSARLEAYGDDWLTIHVRSEVGAGTVAATWKAELLGGAFRDAAHARSVATVLGLTRVVEYPSGRTRESGALKTGPFTHDVAQASPQEVARELRSGFEGIADEAGLERVVVRFIKPTRLAAVIDLFARDPALFGRVEAPRSKGLEGWLVRLHGPSGKVVAIWSSSVRASSGGSWDSRLGARRSGDREPDDG
jgi:hypothetical protein